MAYCDVDNVPLKALITFDLNCNFGLNQREIGELFGVCYQTIQGYMKTWNISYDPHYYQLPILAKEQVIYLACFIETDGCIYIPEYPKLLGQCVVVFSNSDKKLMDGIGNILQIDPIVSRPSKGFKKKLCSDYWGEIRVCGKDNVYHLLKQCLPYMMGVKRDLALGFINIFEKGDE
jgi:hypothetical protein